MWNNKLKALTLSYDDGVMQDKRLVKILNKYGIKCTFNINSGMLYHEVWKCKGIDVVRMNINECREAFKGHEIAAHGLTHPNLCELQGYQLERQIFGDKVLLEELFHTKINGMAYPGGFYDDNVKEILKKAEIKYCRTVNETQAFDICDDLLEFNATCHHNNPNLIELAEKFIELKPEKPQLFYLWGHSYEFDVNDNWEIIEKFCETVSGNDDIYYCTNDEALKPFYI